MAKAYEKQALFAKDRKFPFYDGRRINRHLVKCQKKIIEMREILSKLSRSTPGSGEHLKGLHDDISVLWAQIEKRKVD